MATDVGDRSSGEQLDFFALAEGDGLLKEEALPMLRGEQWGRVEAALFVRHLKRGDLSDALEVLGGLSNDVARGVLIEAGFVPQVTGGRQGMLESVQHELIRAARLRATGHELLAMDGGSRGADAQVNAAPEGVFPKAGLAASFNAALADLQAVLSAPEVEVGAAGELPLEERQSLVFIAGQALERGVSGFAVEGVAGKVRLPDVAGVADLRALYGAAGAALAELEVRSVLPKWAAERGVPRLSDLVPDSVAIALRGGVSVGAAEAIDLALSDGAVSRFGAQQGTKMARAILRQQGVDLDAVPLEEVVQGAGLRMVGARKGQYIGPVVAQDHLGSVVKVSRDGALIVPHRELPAGVGKPDLGDRMLVKFAAKTGQLVGAVVERAGLAGERGMAAGR